MKRMIVLGLIALAAAACGGGDSDSGSDGDEGGTGGGTRTVEVDMADIAFEPETLEVRQGETVRFVFTNTGQLAHDAFIGDADAQADHEAAMRDAEDGGHGGGHDEESDDAITVEPGDTGELIHTFGETGSFEVGCHQEGHYDAGMTIHITVA